MVQTSAYRKNLLTKVVGELLKSAKLDGYFTNHSLHQTSNIRLFQAGVDTKIVREVTGYVSDYIYCSEQRSE